MEKIALVTGSSRGIGRAIARQLARDGYAVCINYKERQDKAQELLLQLQEEGCRVMMAQADVSDRQQVNAMVKSIEDTFGPVSLLVNNAGYGAMGPVLDADRETLLQQFNTNVFAPLELVRAHADLLREAGGLIVNMGSVSGVTTTPFSGVYCAWDTNR